MPGQRYELHHRICNLRYGTRGYETFIIVIILTTFLSADPKPDIWLRI